MTVALFGTGLLGGAIAQRLLACGEELWVWNRSPERHASLQRLGAHPAATPQEAASQASWLITVLSDGPTTRELLLERIQEGLRGRTVIQMGTIGSAESCDLAEAVSSLGGRYLEAPVLGSKPEALAGSLQLMAGGPEELFEQARPLLLRLSAEPVRLGEVGSAMAAKLALNQLIASLSHAFSLSLHLVQRSGVEVEAFMALLRNSALYAPTFDKKLERELTGDYSNPNFPTAHLRKDLALFEKAAQASGLETMGLEGLLSLLQKATPAGLDPLDYCALHALTAGRTAAAEQP
ncbi:MAG: NAD(P)-dependent oxidoreductase [Vulcanococcus sp.]|jgi:3-hydroxyisobutyrate dehydrogenase